PGRVAEDRLPAIDAALRSGEPTLLLLSGAGLSERGLAAAERIRRATGAELMCPSQVPRAARGRGRPPADRVPFPVDGAVKALARFRHIVLCAASPPAAFFAYPGKPSLLAPPDCHMHVLAAPEENVLDALERLAERFPAAATPVQSNAAV